VLYIAVLTRSQRKKAIAVFLSVAYSVYRSLLLAHAFASGSIAESSYQFFSKLDKVAIIAQRICRSLQGGPKTVLKV